MNDNVILVDATGLRCPLPVLKARKAMKALNKGGADTGLVDRPSVSS